MRARLPRCGAPPGAAPPRPRPGRTDARANARSSSSASAAGRSAAVDAAGRHRLERVRDREDPAGERDLRAFAGDRGSPEREPSNHSWWWRTYSATSASDGSGSSICAPSSGWRRIALHSRAERGPGLPSTVSGTPSLPRSCSARPVARARSGRAPQPSSAAMRAARSATRSQWARVCGILGLEHLEQCAREQGVGCGARCGFGQRQLRDARQRQRLHARQVVEARHLRAQAAELGPGSGEGGSALAARSGRHALDCTSSARAHRSARRVASGRDDRRGADRARCLAPAPARGAGVARDPGSGSAARRLAGAPRERARTRAGRRAGPGAGACSARHGSVSDVRSAAFPAAGHPPFESRCKAVRGGQVGADRDVVAGSAAQRQLRQRACGRPGRSAACRERTGERRRRLARSWSRRR